MSAKRHILFVSHSASRNGATLLLLHLLQWLRERTDYQLEVLMNGSGELVRDFRAVCKTRVWRDPAVVLEAWPRRWKDALEPRVRSQSLKWWMTGRRYDLVYLNTAAVSAYVPVLAKHARGFLWHIHELEYALRQAMGEQLAKNLFPMTDRFISVSKPVTDMLIQRFGIPPHKVDLIHGFVPLPKQTEREADSIRRNIRRQLGWSDDAFVVGGCGSLGWRKGTDIFLQVARELCAMRNNDSARFLWIGGGAGGDEFLRFEHDIRAFGLIDRCKIIPNTAAVADYYRAMDVFALTSREDPFPLVMLEAAACNLPILCFDRSGGGPEFVGHDAGLIAPYLDVAALASHLDRFRESPELRRTSGIAAAEKVTAHHTVDTQGPKILESINRCLSQMSD
jgi:glycosyltransferase involved in cell wall biosynthesis